MREVLSASEPKGRMANADMQTFGIVKPYMEMGMTVREAEFAVLIVERRVIANSEIFRVLNRARSTGVVPNFAIVRDRKLRRGDDPKNVGNKLHDNVIDLLTAKELLVRGGADMPKGRAEWDRVVKEMKKAYEPRSFHLVKLLLSRGATISEATQIAQLEFPQTKDPIVKFAQELLATGMISLDLSDHRALRDICKGRDIELPSFAHRVVLEALIHTHDGLSRDDDNPIGEYKKLRVNVFGEEASEQSRELEYLEDVVSEAGNNYKFEVTFGEDEKGSFRWDRYGKWRYPSGIGEGGEITYYGGMYNGKVSEPITQRGNRQKNQ